MEQVSQVLIENALVEHAIEWHLLLHSSEVTEEDRTQFSAWCKLSPQHQMAYERLENLWDKFDGIEPTLAKVSLESTLSPAKSTANTQSKYLKNPSKGTTLGLLAILFSYGLYHSQPAQIWLAQNKTQIGQQQHITLADGSELTLNTDTALDIDFTGQLRNIKLYKGEVFIKVAKDKTRPLIISTNQGSARALGTQFNVHLIEDSEPIMTQVAVVESSVEVCNKPSLFNFNKPECKQVHAGQLGQYTKNKNLAITSADSQSISSWITGTIALDNQPLPKVLHELQRYSQLHFIFDAATLADMRVSGVLPLNDMNKCLSLLSEKLPIQTRRPFANSILIETR